jgi:dihydrofolate synthase/folylpolyglutamate synthase
MDYRHALRFLLSLSDWERLPAGQAGLPASAKGGSAQTGGRLAASGGGQPGALAVVQSREAARFNLERVRSLLARLGNPHLGRGTIHVAGSKGKGSVAAMIASVLRAAGVHAGLYTSPHLHRITERIAVDGEAISPDDLARLTEPLRDAVAAENADGARGQMTTFEALTALAFLYFRERGVEWQVLEVGLGGRLDATNVVEEKAVCVITPISLEHTAVLGETVGQIAAEKAAIITPGATVVMGLQPARGGAAEVIRRACAERGAHLLEVAQACAVTRLGFSSEGQDFRLRTPCGTYGLRLPLLGRHQLENAATAVLALESLPDRQAGLPDHGLTIPEAALRRGLQEVRWPARLEIIRRRPLVVLDGAHNVDSVRRLCQALEEYLAYSRAIVVAGFSADKDIGAIAAEMERLPRLARVIATRSPHPRAAPADAVAAAFLEREIETTWEEDVPAALEVALSLAAPEDVVCVMGSLFVAAEARRHILGLEADPVPVPARAASASGSGRTSAAL